jgi:hypothetical protein
MEARRSPARASFLVPARHAFGTAGVLNDKATRNASLACDPLMTRALSRVRRSRRDGHHDHHHHRHHGNRHRHRRHHDFRAGGLH